MVMGVVMMMMMVAEGVLMTVDDHNVDDDDRCAFKILVLVVDVNVELHC